MKTPRFVALALALVPSALAATSSGEATACETLVRMEPKPQRPSPVQEIARAEKALENGQSLTAARVVLGTFPRIRSAAAGQSPLETRALRVFALALVRSDGTADEKKVRGATSKTWSARTNLEWAARAMEDVDAKRPNDPSGQADLGEALSKLPHGQGRAFEILHGLAKKDLMGSPHAYAALARLDAKVFHRTATRAASASALVV
jgi:hypothetical protein